jgi:dethiobiotin synthetase
MKNIYVAASNQHVGKTTCTLGLVSALMREGYRVGYCKPVGQKSLEENQRVDKDTVLFADLIDFDIEPELHSPIILGTGATTRFLITLPNIILKPTFYQPQPAWVRSMM